MPDSARARRYRVWDLPTRLFHWLLVALIGAQYASGEYHLLSLRWHFWLGYATLALLVFRLLWGLVGSQTSRFDDFVRSPFAVVRYLIASARGNEEHSIGHNPLGGWAVLALLSSSLLQAVSGLFTSDDVDEAGPLAERVPSLWVARFSAIHGWNRYLLLALIGGHVIAVLLHFARRNDDLITPMLHGDKVLERDPRLQFAGGMRALVTMAIGSALVAVLLWWASR
jgi:cytochrome b